MNGHDEEVWVPVWEGPFVEAQNPLQILERAHIPVDLGDAAEPGRARVEVPPGYAEEAREVLSSGGRPDVAMPMIGPQTRSWPIVQIVVVVILIMFVLALVL
ncbi:MAG: hypothetical protein WD646_15065 [Actinomycetota bacterium]